MKQIFNILIFLLIFTASGNATHNRAGQLLYRHISGYTYEFTQIHFFFTESQATEQRIREGLLVFWGDNKSEKMQCVRSEIEILPDGYTKCVFQAIHQFPGPGPYIIFIEDQNRNAGVLNIPNSVNVTYSNTTIFRIDPNYGHNNAPALLTYPIDKAAVGRRFIHNPSAFDIDGDSLSYNIAACTREGGKPIVSYKFPNEIETNELPEMPRELWVDPITGDMVWNVPVKAGLYNVAMEICEWRYGRKISSIIRDMQIEVVDSKNRPPELPELRDTCVIAGTKIEIPVNATDPDNDRIKLTATGGPFQVTSNKAALDIDSEGRGYTNATFIWQTDSSHVRKQPYTVVFKAEDQNEEVKLVTFANFNITVIAPAVDTLTAVAEKKVILLAWTPSICSHASGYEIYRSIGSIDLDLALCETGIPPRYQYERIATVNGIADTVYRDNDNGRGLSPGIEYCYRVVAIFSDGAKSLPSNEACGSLLAGMPPMIRAHVETIAETGEIHVAWLEKPIQKTIDSVLFINPGKEFEYRLFYSDDRNKWTAHPLTTTDYGAKDTVYTDKNRNTLTGRENEDGITEFHHYYKVELWEKNGDIVDPDFEIASTLYPILKPSDKSAIINFGRYTPWVNTEYSIYQCAKSGEDTVFIGTTYQENFIHTGLKNGQEYCYLVRSRGYRRIDGNLYENENWSHVACVKPIDNVPPCTPELNGESVCDDNRHHKLNWTYDHSCMYDMEKFRIYFTYDRNKYERIDSVNRKENDPYTLNYSFTDPVMRVGFYYVTAVDSAGNESQMNYFNPFESKPCSDYELPNVFTPNNDQINDIFVATFPDDGVLRKVDMKIFNRWGKLVFKTSDPKINWDGRDMDSKRFVPQGVYYYSCQLYEEWSTGQRVIPLSGFVHVYHGEGPQQHVPIE